MARFKGDPVEAVPVPDLGRLRAIAAIYFPTSLTLIRSFEERQENFGKFVMDEAKKALGDGAAGLEALKALPMIVTSQSQALAMEFVREMRAHLTMNVPKLELAKL